MTKIKYIGAIETRTAGGCCGRSTASSTTVTMRHNARFMLPNGEILTVALGEIYELTDDNAEFLLDHSTTHQGKKYKMFERVTE